MKKVLRFVIVLLILLAAAAVVTCFLLGNSSTGSEEKTAPASTAAVATNPPATVPPTTERNPSSSGYAEENGVLKYYINGVVQTNTVVGSDEEGYCYAEADGAIDRGYCDGVTVDGSDWIIIEGTAYRVLTDSDKCLFAAAKDVAKCTQSGMTRAEKLKKCFDYIKSNYLEGVLHNPPYPYSEPDWPVVYANDIFVDGMGDCYSFGAAFAYMGRAIGYTEVYACHSGGHGWTEIEERTYDPEWSMHSNNYSYYGMRYDEECDVPYASAIENGIEQKRRQIIINQ